MYLNHVHIDDQLLFIINTNNETNPGNNSSMDN